MNVMQDKIHPMLLPFYEEVRMDDSLTVVIVSFPQGISKPYVVRHQGGKKSSFVWGQRPDWQLASSKCICLKLAVCYILR